MRALREDQDAAAALGVNTTRYKVLVFVVTSSMAALAGTVYAHYVTIITPNNLMILQMSLVVAMAVIAGVESFIAAAIGAILIEFILEMLRTSFSIGGVTVDMTLWRLVFFGIVLMLTLVKLIDDENDESYEVKDFSEWHATKDLRSARLHLMNNRATEGVASLEKLRSDLLLYARDAG